MYTVVIQSKWIHSNGSSHCSAGSTWWGTRAPPCLFTTRCPLLTLIQWSSTSDCPPRLSSSFSTIWRWAIGPVCVCVGRDSPEVWVPSSPSRFFCRAPRHNISQPRHWRSNHGGSTPSTWCGFRDMKSPKPSLMSLNRYTSSPIKPWLNNSANN